MAIFRNFWVVFGVVVGSTIGIGLAYYYVTPSIYFSARWSRPIPHSNPAVLSIKTVRGGVSEITTPGLPMIARVNGDTVEIKDAAVFVNDVSFGTVPANSIVKYEKTRFGDGSLFVDGKLRSPQK